MKLTELDPSFRLYRDNALGKSDTFIEAQGILFDCPVCKDGHKILVWFDGRNVPPQAEPSPRWRASGTGLTDLTIQPSINCNTDTNNCWHGFITNGEVT